MAHWLRYGEDPAAAAYAYGILAEAVAGRKRESAALIEQALEVVEQWSQPHSRAFLLAGVAWGSIEQNDVDGARVTPRRSRGSRREPTLAWKPPAGLQRMALAMQGLERRHRLMVEGRRLWHETAPASRLCHGPASPSSTQHRPHD